MLRRVIGCLYLRNSFLNIQKHLFFNKGNKVHDSPLSNDNFPPGLNVIPLLFFRDFLLLFSYCVEITTPIQITQYTLPYLLQRFFILFSNYPTYSNYGEYLFLVPKKLFVTPNCWPAPKCLLDPNIWIWHLIASRQPKVARSSSLTPYLLFADSAPKPKHPAPILFHVCLPNSRHLPGFMYPNKHKCCIRWCQVPFLPVEIMINVISSQKKNH